MPSNILSGLVQNLPQNIAAGFGIVQQQQQLDMNQQRTDQQGQRYDVLNKLSEQQVLTSKQQLSNAQQKAKMNAMMLKEMEEEQKLKSTSVMLDEFWEENLSSYTPSMRKDIIDEMREMFPDKVSEDGRTDGMTLRKYSQEKANGADRDTLPEIQRIDHRLEMGIGELTEKISQAKRRIEKLGMEKNQYGGFEPKNPLDLTEKEKKEIADLEQSVASFNAALGEFGAQRQDLGEIKNELLKIRKPEISMRHVLESVNKQRVEMLKTMDISDLPPMEEMVQETIDALYPQQPLSLDPNIDYRGNVQNDINPYPALQALQPGISDGITPGMAEGTDPGLTLGGSNIFKDMTDEEFASQFLN